MWMVSSLVLLDSTYKLLSVKKSKLVFAIGVSGEVSSAIPANMKKKME